MSSTDAPAPRPSAERPLPAARPSGAVPSEARSNERPLPIRRLLRALQIMAVVCMVTSALHNYGIAFYDQPENSALFQSIGDLHAVQTLLVSVLWLLRGRLRSPRGRLIAGVLVVVALLPLLMIGRLTDAGFMIPALLVAFALVVLDGGLCAAIVLAALTCLAGIGLHLSARPSLLGLVIGVFNAVPVSVLLLIGVVLGAALTAYERGRIRDVRTIAERDHAVARLEETMERLRRSAQTEKELMLADERARSARDLHDGLGHRLTLISMSLDYARRMRGRDEDAAWAEVGNAAETSAEALTEMRTWVRALSPVRDRDATGTAAIDAIAESFRGTGLDVALERSGPEPSLSDDASLLLYRAVQEGLTNALRHGRARQVRMQVETTADTVRLTLRNDLDDGARASTPVGPLAPGFGLRGLAERAEALGGSAQASRVGDEVELAVTVPAESARACEPVQSSDATQLTEPTQSTEPTQETAPARETASPHSPIAATVPSAPAPTVTPEEPQ